MSLTPGLERVTALYTTDTGLVCAAVVDSNTAVNGQFQVPSGGEPSLPYGLAMRRVTLRGADGSKKILKCGTTAATAWTSGTGFTASFWDGTYTGTGARRGEKQRGQPAAAP